VAEGKEPLLVVGATADRPVSELGGPGIGLASASRYAHRPWFAATFARFGESGSPPTSW
jgi:hypothetical protein